MKYNFLKLLTVSLLGFIRSQVTFFIWDEHECRSNVKNQTTDAETSVGCHMFVVTMKSIQTGLTNTSCTKWNLVIASKFLCIFMFSSPCSFTQNSSSFLSTDMVKNTTLNLPWPSRNDTNTTASSMNSSMATFRVSSTHTPATTAEETPVPTTTTIATTTKASVATPGIDTVTNKKDTPNCGYGAVTLLIGSLVLSAV